MNSGILNQGDTEIAEQLDERFLQAATTIDENPFGAALANVFAGNAPDAGLPAPAVRALNAVPAFAAEDGEAGDVFGSLEGGADDIFGDAEEIIEAGA